jgi:membrane protease YdiL (CAAX protease family)
MVATPVKEDSTGREIIAFLVITFATSWLFWAIGIKTKAREEMLLFGIAGPAFAAAVMRMRGQNVWPIPRRFQFLLFLLLIPVCWATFVLANSAGVRFQSLDWNPLLILPALLPAFAVAFFWTADEIRRLDLRWPLIAVLSMPAYLLIPAVAARVAGMPIVNAWSRDRPLTTIAIVCVLFCKRLLSAGVLEEPGWRGWLLPRLQQRYSPLVASLLVWLPWALWHLPLDFTGGVGRTWLNYLQVRVVFFIPVAILFTWLYDRSRGSIVVAGLFHAGLNTFPFVLPYSPPFVALIFGWAAWVLISDRMWRSSKANTNLQPAA